jgi:hypothetical protein
LLVSGACLMASPVFQQKGKKKCRKFSKLLRQSK